MIMRSKSQRERNEKKFGQWINLPKGKRRYWYEVEGHNNWKARYLKEVDSNEKIIRFWQEIYNETGKLVEIHEKYPVDKGHKKINTGEEQ